MYFCRDACSFVWFLKVFLFMLTFLLLFSASSLHQAPNFRWVLLFTLPLTDIWFHLFIFFFFECTENFCWIYIFLLLYLLMTQRLQTLRIICRIFVDISDQFNTRCNSALSLLVYVCNIPSYHTIIYIWKIVKKKYWIILFAQNEPF